MKCQCQTFTLLDDYANTVRMNNVAHTIQSCLLESPYAYCNCKTFVLDEDNTWIEDDNDVRHTVESCLHECNVPKDLLFDYACSCWKFYPANFAMTLTLTADAWERLRAMIVYDVMLAPYDDTSKRLDSLVDDIDQLINFDESELI